ncbi:MAG: CPBP family intramembrane metalloprotease [Desulfobacterales bacterium]|nr:CPBP family intramembrane metalloprotease [Desulfobacterales bacterium]
MCNSVSFIQVGDVSLIQARRLELIVLFYIVPLIFFWVRHTVAFFVIPVLIISSTICLFYLLHDLTFDRLVFVRLEKLKSHLIFIAIPFLLFGTALTVLTVQYMPELFISFPRRKPLFWGMVMCLYPLLAALPQELIFRVFFFQRYKDLFASSQSLIFFNGISFGLFHLFYANWYAPVLTFFGGWLFAYRFNVTRSLPVVALEHALWGNLLFTIGLGWYFYSGSIVTLY